MNKYSSQSEQTSAEDPTQQGPVMILESLKQLLAQLSALPPFEEPEPTLFSLGGRGYFENPTTDILAFFLDPGAPHKMGALVLSALFECLPDALSQHSISLCTPPEREVATKDGSRIDLLLESDEWIMVLENKIYHHQNNPFGSYQHFASEKAKPKDKEQILVVLSPDGSAPAGWHGIGYSQLLKVITEKLSQAFISQPLNKWHILLREFILHLESLMSSPKTDDKTEAFVLKNLAAIQQALETKNTVIKALQQDCLHYLTQQFEEYKVNTRLHHWNGYPALRFGFNHWNSESDVVLFLDASEGQQFSVITYACDLTTEVLRQTAIEMLNLHDCIDEQWDESRGAIIGFKTRLSAHDRSSLFSAVKNKLTQLQRFEQCRNSL